MIDLDKELANENLTQKDIMQFLLHSTQHVATREELQAVKIELKQDISAVKTELKQDISAVKTELKQDISAVKTELKQDISKLYDKISKVDAKFDKIQWLIIATMITVLLKDYIFSFIQVSP